MPNPESIAQVASSYCGTPTRNFENQIVLFSLLHFTGMR